MWLYLVLLYGVFKGIREICKKKALNTSSSIEVLLVYSLISFVMVIPDVGNALGMEPKYYLYTAIKSFIIFVAWIFSFAAIKRLPLSLFGVLDLSRVLFATLLAVTVLGERMTMFQIAGLVLVCSGLLLLRFWPSKDKKIQEAGVAVGVNNTPLTAQEVAKLRPRQNITLYVILAFLSCALNALSGTMDKILMKNMNSSQLQFWYMFFLVLFYFIYAFITKQKINWKGALKNKWIWLLSILFVVADRALFIANADSNSKVTIMTLIKQSGCIVTILGGRFIFKEKNIMQKLVCAVIIIAGIVLGVIK